MFVLCRVVWAQHYKSKDEVFSAGNMKYPAKHGTAHELMNFADEGGHVYGFVEHNGDWINLGKLQADGDAESVEGVTVIWCALDPSTKKLRVVGWYDNATVYSEPQKRKRQGVTGEWTYQFEASASDAHLVPIAERYLEVPMRTRVTDKGFIGQRNWFFPETSNRYGQFLSSFELMKTGAFASFKPADEDRETFEEGQRQVIEINVSVRNPKLVAAAKNKYGLRCQVCDFSFEDRYGKFGKGFVEVHHLLPLSKPKTRRQSTVDDVRVVCANCHRMIHRRSNPFEIDELKGMLK